MSAVVRQGEVVPHLLLASVFCNKVVKTEAEVKATLELVKVIGKIAIEALQAFLDGRLSRFDALVGENACHTRAVKIYGLFHSLSRVRVEDTIKKIEGVLDRIEIGAFKPSVRFFEEYPMLDFPLDSDTVFIVQAYILTLTKVGELMKDGFTIAEKSSLDVLNKRGITRSSAAKIVNTIQGQLALASVRFVQEQARQLGPEDRHLGGLVAGEFVKTGDYNRTVLPFLFFTEVIFKSLCSKQGRVILKVKKIISKGEGFFTIIGTEVLLFKGREGDFVLIPQLTDADRSAPAVIVEGNCILKEEDGPDFERAKQTLFREGVMKVTLMNAAAHFQYPGTLKHKDKEFEEMMRLTGHLPKYQELKQAAGELGCTVDNRSLFCIDHVFCDLVKHQMESV